MQSVYGVGAADLAERYSVGKRAGTIEQVDTEIDNLARHSVYDEKPCTLRRVKQYRQRN